MNNNGQWAILDIETTGLDPSQDSIIDIGFILFEGVVIKKEFSSRVRCNKELWTPFIQELTHISYNEIEKAPLLEDVIDEIFPVLKNIPILAHNAAFEEKFLQMHFSDKLQLIDSIPFIYFLAPNLTHLSVDFLLKEFKISDGELHQGLEDSRDLYKILLFLIRKNQKFIPELLSLFEKFSLEKHFYYNLLQIPVDYEDESVVEISQVTQKEDIPFGSFSSKSVEQIYNSFYGKYNLNNEEKNDIKNQKLISYRIGQSFAHHKHSVIQAPIGMGASLSYLIPSFLWAQCQSEQILITMDNNSLLTDLEQKYLSLLQALFPSRKTIALLGATKHFCQLVFQNRMTESASIVDNQNMIEVLFARIFHWNTTHPYKECISIDSFPFVLKKYNDRVLEIIEEIKVNDKTCLGEECVHKKSCMYYKGIEESKESSLILGTHNLLFSWPKIINKPDYIIIDQAHKIENTATYSLEKNFTPAKLYLLKEYLQKKQGHHALCLIIKKDLNDGMLLLESISEQIFISVSKIKDEILKIAQSDRRFNPLYSFEIPLSEILSMQRQSILDEISKIIGHLKTLFEFYTPHFLEIHSLNTSKKNEKMKFESFYYFIQNQLDFFILFIQNLEKYCSSFFIHKEEGLSLKIIPIDVGSMIYEDLFRYAKSVISTSATLMPEIGMHWLLGYYNIPAEKKFEKNLIISDDNNISDQWEINLYDKTPNLYSEEYVSHIIKTIWPKIEQLSGKTLLVFSSKQRFQQAINILISTIPSHIKILVQGMGHDVFDKFKQNPHSILVGMDSLLEGLEINAENIKLLVIDKIPDLPMANYIQKRREYFERYIGLEFVHYYLSSRARMLMQKLSRIILLKNDNMICMIFDPRIKSWKTSTFLEFKNLMSPYQIERK